MPRSPRTPHIRFTIRCGKTAIAQRVDRGVRPYGCIRIRIGVCRFAVLYRAGGAEPCPYVFCGGVAAWGDIYNLVMPFEI